MTTATTNQTFASVWDAISNTPQEAANMKAKSLLLMALQKWLSKFDGTQKDAAVLLSISQPRLSDLKRGHIDLFSLDTLLNMADLAGMSPSVQVKLPRMVKMGSHVASVRTLSTHKSRAVRATKRVVALA
jgi:predicted XRE-type DNA-binding protein